MIKKIMILMLFTCSSYAMTFGQAQAIYVKLCANNGFTKHPVLTLNPTSEVNASYFGNTIMVNKGMLTYVHNADELALIIGHELGHYAKRNATLTDYQAEYGADADGAIYAAKAGYNRCIGAKAILRFHDPDSSDHPASIKRYNRIKC